MSRFKAKSIVFLFFLITAGCANKDGFVAMHGSASVPPTELAILKGVYEYRNGSSANETIRIVQVDGRKVPGEFGVAEGANIVTLIPGEYDVKLLWVHASGVMDLYTYSTKRMAVRPNCIYQFYSEIFPGKKQVNIEVLSSPATKVGNQNCGGGLIQGYEQGA